MNGALTNGTLGGANVENRELVGANHFFLFGPTADQFKTMAADDRPWDWQEAIPWLRDPLHRIEHGHFRGGDTEIFRPFVESLVGQGWSKGLGLTSLPSPPSPGHIAHGQAATPEAKVGGVDVLTAGADHIKRTTAAKANKGVIPMGSAQGSHGVNSWAGEATGGAA